MFETMPSESAPGARDGEHISSEQLESLYRSLRHPLRTYLERRLHDPDIAEDLLHDVFVKIHERAGRIERSDRVESWIWAIARNALIDRLRKDKPSESIEGFALATEPTDGREIAPLHRTVRAFLDCIGEPYREALVLADLEGVPQIELARRLGISHSGAKSRVQRARKKMAGLIQECCHLEFDHYGSVIDYKPRGPKCRGCHAGDSSTVVATATESGLSKSEPASCCDDPSSCNTSA
jgi:RNA polymerase sigma-70 factor (ECF subfamily)